MGDADVDKHEPVGAEVEDIRGGATPEDEDFAPIDEKSDVSFGGPGFSCWAPDVTRGVLDP